MMNEQTQGGWTSHISESDSQAMSSTFGRSSSSTVVGETWDALNVVWK